VSHIGFGERISRSTSTALFVQDASYLCIVELLGELAYQIDRFLWRDVPLTPSKALCFVVGHQTTLPYNPNTILLLFAAELHLLDGATQKPFTILVLCCL
jgi:hypothetical protein